MPGPLFTAVFKGVAVTAQQDFFEIKTTTTGSVIVHGWNLSQETEFGDAQEEQLRLTTNRGIGSVTGGSGGSTVTPTPLIQGMTAFGGTVKTNNTTKLAVGSGTLVTDLEVHNWNERINYPFIYPPEWRPIIRPSEYWTLELETTPADSVTVSGTIWFEVIGV